MSLIPINRLASCTGDRTPILRTVTAQRDKTDKDMHTAFFRTILAFAMAAFCALAIAAQFNTVDVHQAQSMFRQGALLLDVREPHEYNEVRAPGSLLVPLAQLKARAEEFRTFENKPVILICRSGQHSGAAAEMLAQQGFKAVHHVQGGIIAWEKAGLPVERR
jgi:rhodanese-related sulfurtransferase